MLRRVIQLNDAATEPEIRRFEARWGVLLPDAYRQFLLQYNGGRPVPAVFPIIRMENNPDGEIHTFFGLHATFRSEDLNWVMENLGAVPAYRVVPIACTDGADHVCIDVSGRGNILFWDRHACWGKDHSGPEDFFEVADSFEELLNSLRDPQVDEETL